MGRVKETLRTILMAGRSITTLLKEVHNKHFELSIKQKLYCIVHGYTVDKYHLYNLGVDDRKYYLNDYLKFKIERINYPYQIMLNDKLVFSKIVDKVFTPEVYGYIQNGQYYVNGEPVEEKFLWELVQTKATVMIKKCDDGGGKGIHRITFNQEGYHIDYVKKTTEQIIRELKGSSRYIVTEYIEQAEYSREIYENATNTIRIMTMRDKKSKEVSIMLAIHKFGSHSSAPTDNIEKGGVSCPIDLETGTITKAMIMKPYGLEWLESHPDSNRKIVGVQLPHWERVKSEVIRISRELEMIHYVGWDVVITDEGFKIIEGNNNPGLGVQFHIPFLKDKKIKKFFMDYDIIKKRDFI